MSTPYSTIMNNVNVVLVDTSLISANKPYIVYVSSVSVPGRVATIRDATGYLSSPNTIIVSTLKDVYFNSGTSGFSSFSITQPFGYITLSSRDVNTWNIINTFAFPDPQGIANVSTLYANGSVFARSLQTSVFISTPYLNTDSISSFNVAVSNVLSTNRLAANAISTNNVQIYNSLAVPSLFVNTISTSSLITQSISTNTFGANTISTNLLLANAISTINIAATAISTNAIITNSLSTTHIAATTISTNSITTNSISTNNILVPSISTTNMAATTVFTNLLFATSISTNLLQANTISTNTITTNSISTNNILVASISTINMAANTVSTNLLLAGSISTNLLATTSISTNAFQSASISTNLLHANIASTNILFAGSVSTTYLFTQSISTNALQATTISTNILTANRLLANSISTITEKTSSLTTSSLTLESAAGAGILNASSDGTSLLFNSRPVGNWISTATSDLFMSTFVLRTSTIQTSSILLKSGTANSYISASDNGTTFLFNGIPFTGGWTANATSDLNMCNFNINNVSNINAVRAISLYDNASPITPAIIKYVSPYVTYQNVLAGPNTAIASDWWRFTAGGAINMGAQAINNAGGFITRGLVQMFEPNTGVLTTMTALSSAITFSNTLRMANNNITGVLGLFTSTINANIITTNNISTNILSTNSLQARSISTISLNANSISTNSIKATTISTNFLYTPSISTININAINVSTNNIFANSILANSVSSINVNTSSMLISSIILKSGAGSGYISASDDGSQFLFNNAPFVSGWVDTATSDLNMNTYSISNVNTITGVNNVLNINGVLNMASYDISNVGLLELLQGVNGTYANIFMPAIDDVLSNDLYIQTTQLDAKVVVTNNAGSSGQFVIENPSIGSSYLSNDGTGYLHVYNNQGHIYLDNPVDINNGALNVTGGGISVAGGINMNGNIISNIGTNYNNVFSNIQTVPSFIAAAPQTFCAAIFDKPFDHNCTTGSESNYLYFTPGQYMWNINVTMYGRLNTTDTFLSNIFTLSNPNGEYTFNLYNSKRPFITSILGDSSNVVLSFNDTINLSNILFGPTIIYEYYAPISINMYPQTLSTTNFSNTNIANWTSVGTSLLNISAVAFGNNTFVAGGLFDAGYPIYGYAVSYDNGSSWNRTGADFGHVYSIAYGNGVWVFGTALEGYGHLPYSCLSYSTSANLLVTAITPSFNATFDTACYGVAFGTNDKGQGTFVAVGSDTSGNNIWYSFDGINWNLASGAPFSLAAGLYGASIVYGNGTFVAIFNPSASPSPIYTSINGKDWTAVEGVLSASYSLAYGNNNWLIYGTDGLNPAQLYYSKDLTYWNVQNDHTNLQKFIMYGDTLIGSDGTALYNSIDNGVNWNNLSVGFSTSLDSAAYGNGVYVIAGNNDPDPDNVKTCSGINTISFTLQPALLQPR